VTFELKNNLMNWGNWVINNNNNPNDVNHTYILLSTCYINWCYQSFGNSLTLKLFLHDKIKCCCEINPILVQTIVHLKHVKKVL
jgi:hypothetical protein